MKRGGKISSPEQRLVDLMQEVKTTDHWLDNTKLREIVSFGSEAVPHLEEILRAAIEKRFGPAFKSTPRAQDNFAIIHALFILAHLRSESSLPLILDFLSQEPEVLDYWLFDAMLDEIWEVLFALGADQLNQLERFILNSHNSLLSRLAVCTALVQIGLYYEEKKSRVAEIFADVLRLEGEDPDFMGLVISELMDFKHEALQPAILAALAKNDVWSGIISAAEIHESYQNPRVRKLVPVNLFERFKLYTYVEPPASVKALHKAGHRNFEKFL
jgi:hypothetical protein